MSETSALAQPLAINEQIGTAESDADAAWFDQLLHERFTMRRPAGQLSSKQDFIDGLNTGAQRRTTMQSIEVHGQYRATARCRVEKWALTDREAVQIFDNLRLFIWEDDRWQLISWLTEPI